MDGAGDLAPARQGDWFGIGGWWWVVLGRVGGFVGGRGLKSRFFAVLRMTNLGFVDDGGRRRADGMRI